MMAARSSRQAAIPPLATNRQNEYFVPRDGIDREVITADICRYLGNDALVRPGVYQAENGQHLQGYYITAYRNLTTAMIEDLKADSARWEQERRAQSARNTPGVQYRNSDTHQQRQYMGPSDPSFPDAARDAMDPNMRYPGTGTGNYTGAATSSAYPAQSYGAQSGYPTQAGYGTQQQQQFAAPRDVSNYGGSSMAGSSRQHDQARPQYSNPVYSTVHTNTYASDSAYGAERDRTSAGQLPPHNASSPYSASGTTQQAGFGNPGSSSGYSYSQAPASSSQYAAVVQPQDPFYGRGNQAYATQEQQYGMAPSSRAVAPSSSAQGGNSGSSSRRDRDSVDRHPGDRSDRTDRGHRHRSAR